MSKGTTSGTLWVFDRILMFGLLVMALEAILKKL